MPDRGLHLAGTQISEYLYPQLDIYGWTYSLQIDNLL